MTTPKKPATKIVRKLATQKVEPQIESAEWKQHFGNSMADSFGIITAIAAGAAILKIGQVGYDKMFGSKAEANEE